MDCGGIYFVGAWCGKKRSIERNGVLLVPDGENDARADGADDEACAIELADEGKARTRRHNRF